MTGQSYYCTGERHTDCTKQDCTCVCHQRKTRQQWRESKQSLNQFLRVGDLVDDEMADYFLCVLPPAHHGEFLIQVGEPHSHVDGRPTFPTIRRTPHGWQYCGNCHLRQTKSL